MSDQPMCSHARAQNGEDCPDCGAQVTETVGHWTPAGPEVLRWIYGPTPNREDRP